MWHSNWIMHTSVLQGHLELTAAWYFLITFFVCLAVLASVWKLLSKFAWDKLVMVEIEQLIG
jgi:hypothetical protein